MTIGAIIFILLCGLIPAFVTAYAVTAIILEKKHKIGDLSYVEFSKHLSKTIHQYECSEKDMESTIANLKRLRRK